MLFNQTPTQTTVCGGPSKLVKQKYRNRFIARQKMKDNLSKCTIKAEIEAESWRSFSLQENPLNLFLMKNTNLDATSLTELKMLSNLLQRKISDNNIYLLELIEEKDVLEQRNEEAEADVKDLMSIM